jgi:hypothetical protein
MDVGEDSACLVLGGIDTGELVEPVAVEVAPGHLEIHAQPMAVGTGHEFEVGDFETEFVEAVGVLGDAVPLVGPDDRCLGGLVP